MSTYPSVLNWALALSIIGMSASPLAARDASDTIYVDGQPCGTFCQSWIGIRAGQLHTDIPKPKAAATLRSDRGKHQAASRYVVPLPKPSPRTAGLAKASQQPGTTAASERPDRVELSSPRTTSNGLQPELFPSSNASLPRQSKAETRRSIAPPETPTKSEVIIAERPDHRAADRSGESPRQTSPQGSTGSLAPHESSSAARPGGEERTLLKSSVTPSANNDETPPQNRDRFAALSPMQPYRPTSSAPDADRRVAIVLTRPDVLAVAGLSGSDVAMDSNYTVLYDRIQNALAIAGASQVVLSGGPVAALDRLIEGEVPAAVLTIISPEAASTFPQISGFNMYRVPLAAD